MLGVTFGNYHSYDDWGIWLEDTHINPPLPKRYIVDVPARNGLLDLTPELTPTIRFENRTLTFNFRVKAGDWSTLVSQIYCDIHGRTLDVVSDLDPDWHWHGCVTVDDFSSDERTGVLVITVDADPFKLSNTENSYKVNGNGTITCMVDRMEISPAFEITAPTTVIYGDSSYTIESTATTEKTLSSDIVSFADGTANPAVDLTVDIEAVQSGTGDPSPDNIRPISGWDEVNVYNDSKYAGLINWNQLASLDPNDWYLNRASITADGTKLILTATSNSSLKYAQISIPQNHKIFVSVMVTTSESIGISIGMYRGTTSTYDERISISSNTKKQIEAIFDAPQSNNAIRFCHPTATTIGTSVELDKCIIVDLTQMFGSEKADEIFAMEQAQAGAGVAYFRSIFKKDYYEYNAGTETLASAIEGTPYWIENVTWETEAGTIYGGTLDVTTGVLTKTWEYIASYNGEILPSEWKSDRDVYVEDTTPTIGAEVVYRLATPQVVQLTAEQVMIFKNQNNIWADSGDVKVTYPAQDYAGKKFFIPDLELTEGNHKLTIQSTGSTTVTYTNGRL